MSESRGIYDTETGQYVDENDNPIPQETAMIPTEIQSALDAINRRIADQTEGLRRVTEGKYNGAAGSAAIVLALEGTQTPITPQPDFK